MKKIKVLIIFLVVIVFIFIVVFLGINKNKNSNPSHEFIDVSDVNNIEVVEKQLGSDIKITQGYLKQYISNKKKIWYESSAKILSVKKENGYCYYVLGSKDNKIKASIESKDCYQYNNKINFVGSVDFKNNGINLAKITKEDINYASSINVPFDDLVTNINLISNTNFIVSGFLVTDGPTYKLFDSKEQYKEDNNSVKYFIIKWASIFNYTGNQKVTIECNIEDTYILNNCQLTN